MSKQNLSQKKKKRHTYSKSQLANSTPLMFFPTDEATTRFYIMKELYDQEHSF